MLRLTRRALFAVWLALSVAVFALVVLTHVSGALGYRLVIVRGPSMAPTIPLGALAFERTVAPTAVAAGDVVTITLPNGVVVTHRVVRVASVDGQPYVETQGDANATADPTLQPASRISGRVEFQVPFAGFVLAYLSLPTGLVSAISMLGTLLAVIWLLEEAEADGRARLPEPRTLGGGLSAA